MNDSQFKEKAMFKLGAIEQHLKNLNGATKDNKDLAEATAKKVAKHDVILGKVGIILVSGVFLITTAINFSWDWIRSRF